MLSTVYNINPEMVKFDDKYVVFNPMHTELEYEATKANIITLGQLDPILMLNGLCIDGRHRTRIASELGIQVKAVDVDSTMKQEDIIILCNKNTMSGRDYDNSQKAIQALVLTTEYAVGIVASAKLMKVDRRLVSYAGTIRGFNRQDILDTLMKDKSNRVQLDGMRSPSRSLEILAKFVKMQEEKQTVVVDDNERVKWNPDSFIKTEIGKAWYYEMLEIISVAGTEKVEMLLGEMANLKFKIVSTAE